MGAEFELNINRIEMVDFLFTTTLTTLPLHLAPHHGAQALWCPSPPLRDVGPSSIGIWGGDGPTEGGTQEVEGPGSASPFP